MATPIGSGTTKAAESLISGSDCPDIKQKLDDLTREGVQFFQIGVCDEAIRVFNSALVLAEMHNFNQYFALMLMNLGMAHLRKGEPEKAKEFYVRCVEFSNEKGEHDREGIANGKLGDVCLLLGEHDKAIECQRKCLEFRRSKGDYKGEWMALFAIGTLHQAKGEHETAIELLSTCHRMAEEKEYVHGMGRTSFNLGSAYLSLANYPKAVEYLKKCVDCKKKIRDTKGEAQAYMGLGQAYNHQGEFPEAVNWYNQSITTILQGAYSPSLLASVYGNLGITLHSMGEWEKAFDCHNKRLEYATEVGDTKGQARAYGNLSSIYISLGNSSKAIEYLEKTLEIAVATSDLELQGNAYGNLGLAYQSCEKHAEALSFFEKSLKIDRKKGDRKAEAITLGNMGLSAHENHDHDVAIEFYTQSLGISDEIGDKLGTGDMCGNLGVAFRTKGELQRSIDFLEKSIALAVESGNRQSEANGHNNLGLTLKELDSPERAMESFRSSIRVYGQMRKALKQDESKVTVFEDQSKPFFNMESLQVHLGDPISALETTESRRGLSLAEQIDAPEVRTPSIAEIQEFGVRSNSTLLYFSIAPILGKALEAYIWCIPPGGEIQFRKVSLDAITNDIEGLDELMNGGPLASRSITSISEAEELTRGRRNPAAAKAKAFRKKLQAWHAALIAPINELLPPKGKLTIIPDGFLSQLPFSIFMDNEGKYLIEDYTVSIAPSVQVLKLLVKRKANAEPAEGALIVGNPTPGVEAAELPMAEQEAMRLKELLGVPDGKTLIKGDAQVGAVKATMKGAKLVHFACHGEPGLKTNVHSVFEGAFLMSPDEDHKKGLLYAEEIGKLDLKANLVFLSACHSGKGAIKREGVIGHMRSFLAAGASSVVGTLWSLPDSELTVDMVTGFYERVLGGMAKDEALREVMLMAIERKRNSPHSWGAFVLTGLPS